jgi:heme exporter protein A
MLEAVNLGCMRGGRRLFKGLNFSVGPGEMIEVWGPNGSGKTSLLRMISGLASASEGEVRWQARNIRSLGEEYSGVIAYLAHQNGIKDELTATENLSTSSALAGHPLNKRETQTILERVGLANQQHLPARVLSAGQRRLVALAGLLCSKASLWLLDEPLASLDYLGIDLAQQLLSNHLSNGGLAIVATHHDIKLSAGKVRVFDFSP